MSLFVEYHLIQNFAPSNLNRDDTGAPKDALFGGHRRARISSQCLKRAVRRYTVAHNLIPQEYRAFRTKKLKQILQERLDALGRVQADDQIRAVLAAAKISFDSKNTDTTQYLLFLGEKEIQGLAELIHEHWDALSKISDALTKASESESRKRKKKAKAALPPEVVNAVHRILDGKKAVDVALFGRMLADAPQFNQDAACQVAHAISTHRVEREFDYFTAVDDMGEEDETGAGMIGHVEFNSATFYRYALIDWNKLVENLHKDTALAVQAVRAFTEAMACAIPTGKQNTFAAHNLPSFVGVVLRHKSPFNLANAFEKPIFTRTQESLTEQSVARLALHEKKVARAFGEPSKDIWGVLDLTGKWPDDLGIQKESLDALCDWVVERTQERTGA